MTNKTYVVNAEEWALWRDDRITKIVIEKLQNRIAEVAAQRLSRKLVVDPNGQLEANYWLGAYEYLNHFLDLFEFEFVNVNKEENNED